MLNNFTRVGDTAYSRFLAISSGPSECKFFCDDVDDDLEVEGLGVEVLKRQADLMSLDRS